MGHDSYKLVF